MQFVIHFTIVQYENTLHQSFELFLHFMKVVQKEITRVQEEIPIF